MASSLWALIPYPFALLDTLFGINLINCICSNCVQPPCGHDGCGSAFLCSSVSSLIEVFAPIVVSTNILEAFLLSPNMVGSDFRRYFVTSFWHRVQDSTVFACFLPHNVRIIYYTRAWRLCLRSFEPCSSGHKISGNQWRHCLPAPCSGLSAAPAPPG